jgi:hypothetical protein
LCFGSQQQGKLVTATLHNVHKLDKVDSQQINVAPPHGERFKPRGEKDGVLENIIVAETD